MPVPISKNHLRNTVGGAYTKQKQGGSMVGLSISTPIITKAILVKDSTSTDNINTDPKEISGEATYNAAKILSGGAFAYNASKTGKWVMSRVTTTLAGVSNTLLLGMGAVTPNTSFPYYLARTWLNNTSLVKKMQFSRTGYDVSGNKIKKRTTWITNPTGTMGTDFGTSTQVPTRAVPGEFIIWMNFVDFNPATSSNYYNYPPITGK